MRSSRIDLLAFYAAAAALTPWAYVRLIRRGGRPRALLRAKPGSPFDSAGLKELFEIEHGCQRRRWAAQRRAKRNWRTAARSKSAPSAPQLTPGQRARIDELLALPAVPDPLGVALAWRKPAR